MATLTLSGQQAYVGGTVGGSALFGYDSNGNRVVRYMFTTGSVGASTVTLKGTIAKSFGDFDISSSYPIRFKITTSSTSLVNAGSGTAYDGQITSTTVNVSANVHLNPNTTYYLWLFPGHTKYSLYYAYDANSAPTLSVVTAIASYKLTTSAGIGSSITVNRTSSPLGGAKTGALDSGATIYYNDVLKITTSASGGYEITAQTINGSAFASGDSKTVTAAVTIATVTALMGLVYIDNGTEFEAYQIYIDNGTNWEQYIPYIDNGSSWDICN